jgi:hypothetical protein
MPNHTPKQTNELRYEHRGVRIRTVFALTGYRAILVDHNKAVQADTRASALKRAEDYIDAHISTQND